MDLAMATGQTEDLMPLTAEQIGGVLAFARREKDLSIAFVASELRIPKVYIQSLENCAYDQLPGIAYVPGYIRSYAKLLDVDPAPLVKAYLASQHQDDVKPKYVFPQQVLTPKMAGSMVAMLLVVVGLAGYVSWFLFERPASDIAAPQEIASAETAVGTNDAGDLAATSETQQLTDADDIAATTSEDLTETLDVLPEFEIADDTQAGPVGRPDNLEQLSLPTGTNKTILASANEASDAANTANVVPANSVAANTKADSAGFEVADVNATPKAPEAPEAPETAAEPTSNNADASAVASSTPDTSVAVATAEAATERSNVVETPAADPVADQVANAGPTSANATPVDPNSEILIRAVSASWVEIVRDNGEIVVSKLLRSGEQLAASSESNLFLSTGNAGGLTLETAALDAFRVGKVGEILRDFPLTSDMLRNRQAQTEN